MCGIVGYIGKQNAVPILMDGLRKESYRGYDSSGIVVIEKDGKTTNVKAVGTLDKLEGKIKKLSGGAIGLGHNRWATHGGVTEENAHPHADCKGNIFVVHNGIIENYQVLKDKLQKQGHKFVSQTDTEVLAHLIEQFFENNLEDAVRKALRLVRGTYGVAVISSKDPEKIVAAKLSSPLVLLVNKAGGFVASDPSALVSHSKKMVFLDDGDVAVIRKDGFKVTDLGNHVREKETTELDWDVQGAQKGGYEHFMMKEMMEQPESLENAMRGRILLQNGTVKFGGLEQVAKKIVSVEKINIIGCGTSYYAGLVGKYMFEEYAGIPTEVDIASEFRYRKSIFNKKAISLFISQSGETADSLAVIKEVKKQGGLTLGIVNVVGSSIAREIEAGVYNHAGPEISVASTKAFTSQLVVLALLTVFLGRQRGMTSATAQRILSELKRIPGLAKTILESSDRIRLVAEKYKSSNNFLYIGRKYNCPVASEGALKLKETSYIHAEGYGAGEIKHGPIALIDENFPVVAICPKDSVYEKMVSNIQELKARKARVIAVTTEGNKEIAKIADDVLYVPKTLEMLSPILTVIPLQLFAYYMSVLRGNNPDMPRNLAKSVTVE